MMLLAQFVQGLTLALVAVIAFIVIGLALTAMILFTKKKIGADSSMHNQNQ